MRGTSIGRAALAAACTFGIGYGAAILGTAAAAPGGSAPSSAVRYVYTSTDPGAPTIVVKGRAGALGAEDSAELHLAEYTGGRIVYRVAVP